MEKKVKAPRVISATTLDRYLGAILALRQRIPIVRSVDVANHLGNSKACVSMALKQMILQELVRLGPHGALLLTETGERRATGHRDSYNYFQWLLVQSGVMEDDARTEAAAITRALSRPSFEALQCYLTRMGIPPVPTREGDTEKQQAVSK
jgi:Mn-dependent DtxR family transcriptional regulator